MYKPRMISLRPERPEALGRRLFLDGHARARLLLSPAQTRLHPETGLLIAPDAAGNPYLYGARIDEQLLTEQGALDLNTHFYRNAVVQSGWRHVTGVRQAARCETLFSLGGRELLRSFFVLPDAAAVGMSWRLLSGPDATLTLRPLLALRPLEGVQHAHELPLELEQEPLCTRIRAGRLDELFWGLRDGKNSPVPLEAPAWWYYQVAYPEGPPGRTHEDLFSPGAASLRLSPGEEAVLILSLTPEQARAPRAMLDRLDAQSPQGRPQLSGWLERDVQDRLARRTEAFFLGSVGNARFSPVLPENDVSLAEQAELLLGLLPVQTVRAEAPGILLRLLSLAPHSSLSSRDGLWSAILLEGLLATRLEGGGEAPPPEDDPLLHCWTLLVPFMHALLAEPDLNPLEGALDDALEPAALQAGGLLAGATLACWAGEPLLAQELRAKAERLREVGRLLPVPTSLLPTRGWALALGLPHPLFTGPRGWALADALLAGLDVKGSLPAAVAGWTVQALRRQLQRPLPALAALWGPLLGRIQAGEPLLEPFDAAEKSSDPGGDLADEAEGGVLLAGRVEAATLAFPLLALRSGRLCAQVPQR